MTKQKKSKPGLIGECWKKQNLPEEWGKKKQLLVFLKQNAREPQKKTTFSERQAKAVQKKKSQKQHDDFVGEPNIINSKKFFFFGNILKRLVRKVE